MIRIVIYFFFPLFTLITVASFAQGISIPDTIKVPVGYKPEFRRQSKHDAIDKLQKSILASDGKADMSFAPGADDNINFLLTQTLIKKVDIIQFLIETDTLFDHRLKVVYLSGLENVLKYFRQNWRSRSEQKVNPLNLPLIVNAYWKCMSKDRESESIESIIDGLPYDAALTVINATIFDKNPGYKSSKENILLKYCILYPDKIFPTLQQNPDLPFADSLVRAIAPKYTKDLYEYAAANNKLGYIIRNIVDDPLVRSIVAMAKSKSGQFYFPFLDVIVKGKLTLEEIDSVKNDSLLYYRLLVHTQMDYIKRALDKDTALEFESLTDKLKRIANEIFVTTINRLHEEKPEVRFKCIQPLTAEELYYLAVSSDGTIYTSSFVKGVYPLMITKINNKGDSLLTVLHFDKYRKFIKMAAGYNTLSDFLSSFPPVQKPATEGDAEKLMRAFVAKLETTDGLEAGVDVADSYASIAESMKPIAAEMLKNIQLNYTQNEIAHNKRGQVIYNILHKLFLSADSSKKVDLTKELGIPPVYEVPYRSLVNDSGRVIMQVFFYGDKDGQNIYNGFLRMFSNANWKIISSDKWVCINAAKGKAVSIYANKPLPEESGEDEQAQKELCRYLANNDLYPSVTIHRGHSYTAPYTVKQMAPSSKIVFMGSCGGYFIVKDILQVSPDAHIIATRQIGDTKVNKPFFELLTEKVRTGKDVQWIPFWKELGKMAKSGEFDDYMPPYKNLGALFIKAYKIAMTEEEE